MITYIIIFVFFILFSIIILYISSTYLFPRKLDEIAVMVEKGQTKIAIKKLTDFLEKDDRNAYAHYLLAEAYKKEKNFSYAILEYRQVLKIARYDNKVREVDVRQKLAKLFKDSKKISEAKNEYLILTKIDSANYVNYLELGMIFFNSGMLDKALPYFKKSIALNNSNAVAYYHIGQILYRTGNYQEAKQAFIETIKIEQNNYKAHYFLGLVLRQLHDYEWAIKEFEIAQKSDEIRTKCFLAKGTCFLEKEQFPKAVIEFERGLKSTPKGSEMELNLRYFLASAHEKLRDMHSAIENWEKIYEVNKRFRDVEEKLKQFSEFRQDDRIKDFMIASLSQFEHTCRKIIESMSLNVSDIKILNDTDIEIFASDADDSRRNTRRMFRLVRVLRTTNNISDNFLRKLHETMKPRSAQRLIVISTGDFTKSAKEFANTRPVDLIGKSELVDVLKNI